MHAHLQMHRQARTKSKQPPASTTNPTKSKSDLTTDDHEGDYNYIYVFSNDSDQLVFLEKNKEVCNRMKTNRLGFFHFFFYENRQFFLQFNPKNFSTVFLFHMQGFFFLRHCRSLILLYELVGRKIKWTVRKKIAEI